MTQYDTLLISCIDKRFVETTTDIITDIGLTGEVYRMAVAGSSLINSDAPDYFDKHIRLLSKTLRKVIIIDHEDCVAYQVRYGGNNDEDHLSNQQSLATRIRALNHELGINIVIELYMVNKLGELLTLN